MCYHPDVPAAFTQRFQVRFDECAPGGSARASALLRCVIETAFGHSAREGFPLAWYEARGLFWLVRHVRMYLFRPLPYGLPFDVTTEVVGFRRIWARRKNSVRDAAGEVLATVTVDWIFTDRAGNPARIVPEMEAAFPGASPRMEAARLHLGDPPAVSLPQTYVVPAYQVDPRGHMNSAAYLDVFEDAIVDAGDDPQQRPCTYELEYLRAARPGEVLRRFVWRNAAWAMVVTTAEGLPVVRARRQPAQGRSLP
ncbi:MAG: thioesterase [Armatimonadota bacterium]|nr:thioesterase [Armatimonadota bacterium]MDR7427451.1 thioesterase [Armatimonadota bacterium]MDR7465045.1 thioesterase [Armatimonadota bacterium]MDR7469989.1 thioesterase [Armatimonadota bacterium]MDR7540360.1 thioesterase [Armatimonadota bacterium]